jgi:hypothetical protein
MLCRACDPLHGLDANDGRDDRIFEAVIGFAEVFLHGLGVEATSDLLGGGNRELAVSFACPAWAPRAIPTSCDRDTGTQAMVENP